MTDLIASDALSVFFSTFALIALAEIGDKSQLVCMTLAMRHRHWPVILGSAAAFIILNSLAVLFGATVSRLVPEWIVAAIVALLFGFFGLHVLMTQHDEESAALEEKPGHGIFLTTFLLIFVAEFGDKTQIAVAGLASTFMPLSVWIGATTALITLSVLGVWAGRTLLQSVSAKWLNRFSGSLFLLFSFIASWKALTIH